MENLEFMVSGEFGDTLKAMTGRAADAAIMIENVHPSGSALTGADVAGACGRHLRKCLCHLEN